MHYHTQSGYYNIHSTGQWKGLAEKVRGGAALESLIGALAGYVKAAAKGLGVAAVAGRALQALHRPSLEVPTETLIDFALSGPIVIQQNKARP